MKMTAQQRIEAVEMLRKGLNQGAVGDYYSVSRQYIHILAKAAGLTSKLTQFRGPPNPHSDSIAGLEQRAQALSQRAIKLGVLVRQPCEICGSTRYVQGHHDDYGKPLDIRWLCQSHHQQWHGQNEALNSGKMSALRKARRELKRRLKEMSKCKVNKI
jgi:hypothetical protein